MKNTKNIITSTLDNDLYKFNMQQYVLHQFPKTQVEYAFKCRNNIDLVEYQKEIKSQISQLQNLKFEPKQLDYLSTLSWLTEDYIDYLSHYKFNPKHVKVDTIGGKLRIKIVGPWLETILFEVPVLAIVQEVRSRALTNNFEDLSYLQEGLKRLKEKIELVKKDHLDRKILGNSFCFSDFGTRRRFSKEWQDNVVQKLASDLPNTFMGTSNLELAKKYGIKPIGTQAHEIFQASQAFTHILDSQKFTLDKWMEEFRGQNGIALTDIFGHKKFIEDFDLLHAKMYAGVRHDSGDPFEWGHAMIKHFTDLGINPEETTFVWSDGLTMKKAINLYEKFYTTVIPAFGIGTMLTNDVGIEPLQAVIKMVKCNGKDVLKISDDSGKIMCENQKLIDYVSYELGDKDG